MLRFRSSGRQPLEQLAELTHLLTIASQSSSRCACSAAWYRRRASPAESRSGVGTQGSSGRARGRLVGQDPGAVLSQHRGPGHEVKACQVLADCRSSPHLGAYWMGHLLPCSKSCPHRADDTALPAGESPHRIDAIPGWGRGMLAGVHRGRSTDPKTVAVEPNRSTGSSPPFRLRDRVASHCPPAGGLALPGRRPPPIPPRRSPTGPTLGLGHQLVVGRLFHPRASGDRVGHSGWRTGSCGGRRLVPTVASRNDALRASSDFTRSLPHAGFTDLLL